MCALSLWALHRSSDSLLPLQGGQTLNSTERCANQSYKPRLPPFTPRWDGMHPESHRVLPGAQESRNPLHMQGAAHAPRTLTTRTLTFKRSTLVPTLVTLPQTRVGHRAPNFHICFCLKD